MWVVNTNAISFYPQACEAQGTFGDKNIKVQKIKETLSVSTCSFLANMSRARAIETLLTSYST